MSNILRDISDFEFDHNPSSYVEYKHRLRHRSIAFSWSDHIFKTMFFNHACKDVEDLIEDQICTFMRCIRSDGECNDLYVRIHMNCSVKKPCILCNKTSQLPPGHDVESLLAHKLPRSARGLIQSLS